MNKLPLKYSSFHSHLGEKRKLFGKLQFIIRFYNRFYSKNPLKKSITNLIKLGKITLIQGRILDLIYRQYRFHGRTCYLSQLSMSKILRCDRKTVNRNLKKLEALKLIVWAGTHLFTSRTRCGWMVETNCYATKWNKHDITILENQWTKGPSAEECRRLLGGGIPVIKLAHLLTPQNGLKTGEVHNRESQSSSSLQEEKDISLPTTSSDIDLTKSAKRIKSANRPFEVGNKQNKTSGLHHSQVNSHGFNNCLINKNKNKENSQVKINIHGFNKCFNKQSSCHTLNHDVTRQNECLRDTTMGFFTELDTTKKNSRFSEFDYAAAKRLRKAIIDGKFIFSRIGSIHSWAKEFYQLRKFTTEAHITKVLDWYIANIGGEYIPQAFCAATFRKKFPTILAICHRRTGQIHTRDLNEYEQEFYNQMKMWNWKSNKITPDMVKGAIIKNTDEYRKFRKAVCETVKELSSKSSNHECYLEIIYANLNIPEEYSRESITNIFHGLDNWDQWHGNLISSCFDTKKAPKVENELVNLVKSASSGLVDRYLQDIITHVKKKLEQ